MENEPLKPGSPADRRNSWVMRSGEQAFTLFVQQDPNGLGLLGYLRHFKKGLIPGENGAPAEAGYLPEAQVIIQINGNPVSVATPVQLTLAAAEKNA